MEQDEIKSGVYIIICLNNFKFLIGQSNNISKRFNYHKQNLRKNKHENPHLQNAWNKHSEDNFLFEILEKCNDTKTRNRENYWCKLLDSHNSKIGYNIRATDEEIKVPMSIETRNKIRESQKRSEKFLNRDCGKSMRGKIRSIETREKISKSSLGKKHSEKTKMKLSEINKGRVISSEMTAKRIKTRKSNGKKWHSIETLEKIRVSNSKNKILRVNLLDSSIEFYDSISDAARKLGRSVSYIFNRIKNQTKKDNYLWKKKD